MTAPDLTAFGDFLDDDGFTTPPIKSTKFPEGKSYLVPSPDGETGARLVALGGVAAKKHADIALTQADLDKLNLNDQEERDFIEMCLGTAYAEMIADGVSWQRISRLGQYAFVVTTQGQQAATDAAKAGYFSGKAPARNRAQTRAAAKGTPTTAKASAGSRKPRPRPTA
jgi:hypothetical protein